MITFRVYRKTTSSRRRRHHDTYINVDVVVNPNQDDVAGETCIRRTLNHVCAGKEKNDDNSPTRYHAFVCRCTTAFLDLFLVYPDFPPPLYVHRPQTSIRPIRFYTAQDVYLHNILCRAVKNKLRRTYTNRSVS